MAQIFEDYPDKWGENTSLETNTVSEGSSPVDSSDFVTSEATCDTNFDETYSSSPQAELVELPPQKKRKFTDSLYDGQLFSGYVPFQKIKPDLVQIKAGTANVLQRIKCFQARKRDKVNSENIGEFLHDGPKRKTQGCARADSVVNIRSDGKSHIKVYRVVNEWGPQTRGVDPGSIPHPNPPDPILRLLREQEEALIEKMCGTCGNSLTVTCPESIDERLENAEVHLRVDGPVPRDIYMRIKQIEDRLLELEGISPEYSVESANNFLLKNDVPLEYSPLNKRGYSKYELKRRMTLMQNDVVMKRLKREKGKELKKEQNLEVKKVQIVDISKEQSEGVKVEEHGESTENKSLEVKKE